MNEAIELMAFQSLTCPRCGSRPGQFCVSVNGRRARVTHASRTRLLYLAYNLGVSYATPMTETAR